MYVLFRVILACLVGTSWGGFFEDVGNWIEDTAQEAIDTAEEIGQDVKGELEQAGKDIWNEMKEEYERIEREFEKAQDKLENLRNKLEREVKNITKDIKKTINKIEGFGEDFAETMVSIAKDLDEDFLQNLVERLHVKRCYFHGNAKDVADGVFPQVVFVTGVGDDIRCNEFQFNARKPVESLHQINKELAKMLLKKEGAPCKDLPKSPCI